MVSEEGIAMDEEKLELLDTEALPNWSAYQNAESKKLLPKRLGPFKVLEVDNLNYRLELPPMLKNHPIFHVSKLKLYHKPSHSHTPPRPPPVVIDSVEE